MSYVFHRTLQKKLPTIVAGEGHYLIDDTGKRYLDACGGAAVSCLGHDNASVRAAITDQLGKLTFAHTGFFTNEPAEALAEYLVTHAPAGTGRGRVMFLGSGSEAMEAALKLARQYHLERGQPERTRIIARNSSYHGNTLGALAVGGHAGRRAPFQPMLVEFSHIDPCYAYRYQRDGESEEAFGQRMADQLEAEALRLGPETVAAFVAEPVVGATLGSVPAATGYFRRIREICDRHGIVFIADEVMCGMGRTGSLFALEQEGVHADITIIAKGLGAGYQPIAGLVASGKVVEAVEAGSGRLWNGHTYMSHAVACAGALAVLKEIEGRDLLRQVGERGAELSAALHATFGQHPHVGDIRGRGLFWSIEIVKDRGTKSPFDAALALAPKIQAAALEAGLMCYPSQGTADGKNGDHVLLAPAYTSETAEIERIVELLSHAVQTVLNAVPANAA